MVEKDFRGASGDRKTIHLPLTEESARSLRAGDIVSLNGTVVTGRDRAHKYLFEQRPPKDRIPFDLRGIVLYHCGPVMQKTGEGYKAVAAGPTTSIRVEMYEAALIREYGIRGIMGKGGMGENTVAALKETGSVYFQTVGGAAVLLADCIKKTLAVWKLDEFGPAEAMWLFEVEDFPAIVTIDSCGNNIHAEIEKHSREVFSRLIGSR